MLADAMDWGQSHEGHGDVGLRELIAMREIARAFLTAQRAEDVFQFALDRVTPLVGATFACVYVIEDGTDLMRLAAVHNWPQRYARFLDQIRVRLGLGPSGIAALERRAVEIPDVFADVAEEEWQEIAEELGFRALVALPLETPTGVLGAVTFYFAAPNSLSPETRGLVRMVADQMAAIAEKARLIQDLQRANARLTESNVQLERQYNDVIEARRVKDQFLANISHELRTPLTAVIGYISLMQEGVVGEVTDEQNETLDQVKASSEHLLALIADLLELTALKRGALDFDITEVDPREPLREAVATSFGKKAAVELKIAEPEGELPRMRTDRKKVTRALRALIDNAFKFTAKGTITVSVEISGQHVAYTIQDTGIGIPAEAQQLIFDEFRQLDGSLTRQYGGSGLGLSLARRLARLVQGDISLESEPGVGSTFRLDLPLRMT